MTDCVARMPVAPEARPADPALFRRRCRLHGTPFRVSASGNLRGRSRCPEGQGSFKVQAFPFRMTPENMVAHRDDPMFSPSRDRSDVASAARTSMAQFLRADPGSPFHSGPIDKRDRQTARSRPFKSRSRPRSLPGLDASAGGNAALTSPRRAGLEPRHQASAHHHADCARLCRCREG